MRSQLEQKPPPHPPRLLQRKGSGAKGGRRCVWRHSNSVIQYLDTNRHRQQEQQRLVQEALKNFAYEHECTCRLGAGGDAHGRRHPAALCGGFCELYCANTNAMAEVSLQHGAPIVQARFQRPRRQYTTHTPNTHFCDNTKHQTPNT